MKRRLAIVIAVERYPNSRVKTVNYAEADAKGFAKALENGGPLDKVFLLSGKATRTTISSQVRQNVKTLTKEAVNNADLKLAIQIRCREKLKSLSNYTSMNVIPEFYVGAGFHASLVRNQASGDGKFASLTLEGCASALLQKAKFEWNAFDKAARKADNAIPLRAHLSKGGTAIRLMAWHRPVAPTGRCLEFSNIGPKWEEEISDTSPTIAV